MVNICGHGLCENCVELLFVKGSNACPQCNVPLRRVNFRFQLFENSFVEKEVDIRRKILKDFNKKEEDFSALNEYNDYLEEIENIVFNLTNDIDVEETKKKVEQYKKENKEAIAKNKTRKSKDEVLIEDLIEEEKEVEMMRRHNIFGEHAAFSRSKAKKNKEALVDELMFSDLPANQIMATHDETQKRNEQHEQREQEDLRIKELLQKKQRGVFSTGIKVGRGASEFLPVPKPSDSSGEVYKHVELTLDLEGPKCPTTEELDSDGYLLHVRPTEDAEKAGGFVSSFPCYRALQEAFCGLYYETNDLESMNKVSK